MPRPSSPLNAKASVRSPYALDRSQQNSCVGTKNARRRYETPSDGPHMRFDLSLSDNDVFTKVHPRSSRGSRINPSIHDVISPAAGPNPKKGGQAAGNSYLPDRLRSWWSQTGSNRRPHACKARALPTELWPLITSEAARAGSSSSIPSARPRVTRSVVGPGGLEPPTSRLSGVCSNQLSYRP